MPHKSRVVPLRDVFLDTENPRHDLIDNEADIIHRLVMMEGVKPLAADIAEWGLSPLERMGVTPHPTLKDRYITAEGNRRLCALKLLADPDKAPDERSRKVFRDLKAQFPERGSNLEVVIFDDEAEARHWVELRHRGPQEGKGTKPWNPRQKTRFDEKGKRDNPNALALRLLDYATEKDLIEDRDGISLTTLTRYLSNRVVRDALGLGSNRELVRTAKKPEQFDRGIKRFLQDAAGDGPDSLSSRTNSAEREAYADRFRKRGYSPKVRTTEPILVTPPDDAGGLAPGSGAKRPLTRERQDPGKRRNVVPSTFKVQIDDKIFRRIYIELKGIDASEHPFAAHYLLRAFIELAVKRYCKKHGLAYKGHALEAAILRVDVHLKAQGVDERLTKPLRVMASDEDAFFSPDSIGHLIHGGAVARRQSVIDAWDSVEEALFEILKRL